MQFTSHLFEISLTGYKDPEKCVVNRISWPRGWGEIYSWLVFFSPPLPIPAPTLVNICKVSAVIFRVKPSISSQCTPFKQTQEAVQRKMDCVMKKESKWHCFLNDIHSDEPAGEILEVCYILISGKLKEYHMKSNRRSINLAHFQTSGSAGSFISASVRRQLQYIFDLFYCKLKPIHSMKVTYIYRKKNK